MLAVSARGAVLACCEGQANSHKDEENNDARPDRPVYWTVTTLLGGASAMYVAFGRAAGWMSPRGMAGGPPGRRGGFSAEPGGQPGFPPGAPASPGQAGRAQSGGQAPDYRYVDVHGAGAQRSDPKAGNPAQFPYGRSPQGDVVRIFNFVRLVRDAEAARPSGNN